MKSIDKDFKQFERALDKINGQVIPKSQASALNKSSTKIVSRVAVAVSKKTKVPQKHIKRKIYKLRARGRWMNRAKIWLGRDDISVVSLKHRVTKKKGINAAGRRYSHAFKADGSKGYGRGTLKNAQIFERKSREQYPIEPVKINIKNDIDDVSEKVVARVMMNEYPKLFEHDINWRLKKLEIKL